jgi:hypothetical protein
VVEVGEQPPQKKKPNNLQEGEVSQGEILEKKERADTPIGYLGQTALRRKQWDRFSQSVARQRLNKHVPTDAPHNNVSEVYEDSMSAVFSV